MFDIIIHKWLGISYGLYVHTLKKRKKAQATVLFIHGIGASGVMWQPVIAQLPDTIAIVAIDLLGFGHSPSPLWARYDAKTQADAVVATLRRRRFNKRLIIVGHSLGALVAVEIATRHPAVAASLVLCSPPFYKDELSSMKQGRTNESILKYFYRLVGRHPDQFLQVTTLASRLGLMKKNNGVSTDTIGSYMSTIEASILNQTALADAKKLRLPIRIIHGSLDPVVIPANIKALAVHTNVKVATVLAGHDLKAKKYITGVAKEIRASIDD